MLITDSDRRLIIAPPQEHTLLSDEEWKAAYFSQLETEGVRPSEEDQQFIDNFVALIIRNYGQFMPDETIRKVDQVKNRIFFLTPSQIEKFAKMGNHDLHPNTGGMYVRGLNVIEINIENVQAFSDRQGYDHKYAILGHEISHAFQDTAKRPPNDIFEELGARTFEIYAETFAGRELEELMKDKRVIVATIFRGLAERHGNDVHRYFFGSPDLILDPETSFLPDMRDKLVQAENDFPGIMDYISLRPNIQTATR